jgi:uncharacterized protein YndB with AHSA1/START domain
MIKVSECSVVHRPPEDVFAIAADPNKQLKWDRDNLRDVEKISPGPLGRGARYRGDFKGVGTVEYDFVEYDPPRLFAHHAAMKIGEMTHTFRLEPIPEGTRLTQVAELVPNLLGRIMAPALRAGFRKRFRQIALEIDQYSD